MSFDDYCKYFKETAICRVVNTSMFSLNKTWHEGLANGAWKTPGRAGGCINHKETFTKNPQVRVFLEEEGGAWEREGVRVSLKQVLYQ